MASKKTTWQEKLHKDHRLPMIKKIEGKLSQRWGTGTFVIPKPIEVDAIMKKVPRGKLITINEIRARLAKKHKTNIACPITTGIFAWIAANAAAEEALRGKKTTTPYWRTLKTGGLLNEKYPGGVLGLKKHLEKEGHRVVKKGKNYIVVDYEKKIIR